MIVEKTCPKHGTFTDTLAIDPNFLTRIERLFPGRDFKAVTETLRNHGTSSIQYGRGSVLTVDLTNRCNMMCDPCFMDANQVGYVHELTLDDVKKILDDAITIKPRRQMTVQFSGGEPTLSPHFLDAIAYAREVGYFGVQCATNGLRFAQEPSFAKAAAEAGLRMAYLQFDGIGNEANAHRKIGNLFDVKLRAIEELAAGGHRRHPGRHRRQRGQQRPGRPDHPVRHRELRQDHRRLVPAGVVHRPRRGHRRRDASAQRYTLSHLAHDVKAQTGVTEPLRDWFPLSALGPFVRRRRPAHGRRGRLGHDEVRLPPELRHRHRVHGQQEDQEVVPLTEFLDIERFSPTSGRSPTRRARRS